MEEVRTVQLQDLVGEHILTGVDRLNVDPDDRYEHAAVLNFVLDGVTYSAVEDPEDGYRSSMREIRVLDGVTANVFESVRVRAQMRESEHDEVLELVDLTNGQVVLSVGTNDTDDYYPIFVADFDPRKMHINERRDRVTEQVAGYTIEATEVRQVQIVWGDGRDPSFVNIPDILNEGEDITLVNDTELLGRVARWLDRDDADLRGMTVTRAETGNIVVNPKPVFG